MSSKYSLDTLRQSLKGNLRRYEAIALSMAISFEIEDFIQERGITKQELADASGVSPSYLSQVFSGDKLFNLSMLAGIAQKYDIRFSMSIEDAQADIASNVAFLSWPEWLPKKPEKYLCDTAFERLISGPESCGLRAAGGS